MHHHCTGWHDRGILLIRVALGLGMAFHGAQMIMGGEPVWTMVGGRVFGEFMPMAAGLIAALIMLLGGLAFTLGLAWHPASIGLGIVMLGATYSHLAAGDSFFPGNGPYARHAFNLAVVFWGLSGVGPGKYSVAALWCCHHDGKDRCDHDHEKNGCCGGGGCHDDKPSSKPQ